MAYRFTRLGEEYIMFDKGVDQKTRDTALDQLEGLWIFDGFRYGCPLYRKVEWKNNYDYTRETGSTQTHLVWKGVSYTVRNAETDTILRRKTGSLLVRGNEALTFEDGTELTDTVTKALGNHRYIIAGVARFSTKVTVEFEGEPAQV